MAQPHPRQKVNSVTQQPQPQASSAAMSSPCNEGERAGTLSWDHENNRDATSNMSRQSVPAPTRAPFPYIAQLIETVTYSVSRAMGCGRRRDDNNHYRAVAAQHSH